MDVYSELAGRLRPVLLRLGRRVRQTTSANLTAIDASLLMSIRRRPGVKASDMADSEGMSRPAMSAHLKRLESLGLIARRAHREGDRRSVEFCLSDKGNWEIEQLKKLRSDWLVSRLQALDEREFELIFQAIGPLENLTKQDACK